MPTACSQTDNYLVFGILDYEERNQILQNKLRYFSKSW